MRSPRLKESAPSVPPPRQVRFPWTPSAEMYGPLGFVSGSLEVISGLVIVRCHGISDSLSSHQWLSCRGFSWLLHWLRKDWMRVMAVAAPLLCRLLLLSWVLSGLLVKSLSTVSFEMPDVPTQPECELSYSAALFRWWHVLLVAPAVTCIHLRWCLGAYVMSNFRA
jgi:hypothetical protein